MKMKMAFAPSEHAHDQLDGGAGDDYEAFRPISVHFLLVVLVAGEGGGVALGEEQVQHATVDNQQADDAVHA